MKLLEQVVVVAQRKRLAENTIDAYLSWIRQFLKYSASRGGAWKRPAELGTADVEAFLNHLVVERKLSASSQNQALNGIVFLYNRVLVDELGEEHLGRFAAERSKRPGRLPTVLSVNEVLEGRWAFGVGRWGEAGVGD
jgi:site-specific recombinase XerD